MKRDNPLFRDERVIREVISEALQGNSDAKQFVGLSQQGLALVAMYEQVGQSIQDQSDGLAMAGNIQLAKDGAIIANRLFSNAKLLKYSICESVRGAWQNKGEKPIPESKGVLSAKEVVYTPIRLRSSQSEIEQGYRQNARFFMPDLSSDVASELFEKETIFKMRHTTPIIISLVPTEILRHYDMKGRPQQSFLIEWFKNRS
jgi:hypothetical protein